MKTPTPQSAAFIGRIQRVEQQINQKQLKEAAQELNQLVKLAPNDARLFLLGSYLAEAAGSAAGMLDTARKAQRLAPHWPLATLRLAEVLAVRGENAEAISVLSQATGDLGSGGKSHFDLHEDAAGLVYSLGEYPLALQWLQAAQLASPGKLSIGYKIGLTLSAIGRLDEAIETFTNLLVDLPNNAGIRSARLRAAMAAKRHPLVAEDAAVLMGLEPENPEYRFYLALAQGESPATMPTEVVRALFQAGVHATSAYTPSHSELELPRHVAQLIHQWHPDKKGDLLDLGCGTGLLGACLGPIEGVVVGVDLSAAMIKQATQRQVYDKFHQVNVLDALVSTPAEQYHVMTGLNLLPYIGDLAPFIPNAHRILVEGGHLVLSFDEAPPGEASDFVLSASTQRYAHRRAYVERLLLSAGFRDIVTTEWMLHVDVDHPTTGLLVMAQRPSTVKTVA